MKCPTCDGTGIYHEHHDPNACAEELGCPDCEGTGQIPDKDADK